LKRILGIGVIAAVLYVIWRALDERSSENALSWRVQPFPSPPMPVSAEPETQSERAPEPAWVAPIGNGCPATHPVKAKLASGIFHLPGGQMYERTIPDRCYVDASAAEADGLRASRR
jgi:hypothetical protein